MALLRYFDATEKLSGSKYATISQVYPIFSSLKSNMQANYTDSKLTSVLKQCLAYYTDFYMKKWIPPNEAWYCASTFLDIRVKSFSRLTPAAADQKKKLAIMLLTEMLGHSP